MKCKISGRKLSWIHHRPDIVCNEPKWATPIFVEKTFTNGIRFAKFMKVFFLESFPLYGNRLISEINCTLVHFRSTEVYTTSDIVFWSILRATAKIIVPVGELSKRSVPWSVLPSKVLHIFQMDWKHYTVKIGVFGYTSCWKSVGVYAHPSAQLYPRGAHFTTVGVCECQLALVKDSASRPGCLAMVRPVPPGCSANRLARSSAIASL